jgi:hypothetical protein
MFKYKFPSNVHKLRNEDSTILRNLDIYLQVPAVLQHKDQYRQQLPWFIQIRWNLGDDGLDM